MSKKWEAVQGSEAIIPVISLVALLYGDIETASDGIRQHQNASSEASSRYSHSINLLFHLVIDCSSLYRHLDVSARYGTW